MNPRDGPQSDWYKPAGTWLCEFCNQEVHYLRHHDYDHYLILDSHTIRNPDRDSCRGSARTVYFPSDSQVRVTKLHLKRIIEELSDG